MSGLKIGAAAAALVGGLALGSHFMSVGEPESCKMNGDGEIVLSFGDGSQKNAGHTSWKVDGELKSCYASNGSAPPLIVPYRP